MDIVIGQFFEANNTEWSKQKDASKVEMHLEKLSDSLLEARKALKLLT